MVKKEKCIEINTQKIILILIGFIAFFQFIHFYDQIEPFYGKVKINSDVVFDKILSFRKKEWKGYDKMIFHNRSKYLENITKINPTNITNHVGDPNKQYNHTSTSIEVLEFIKLS